ncbi:alpha/beta hydrolase [Streptomyces mirabilis]
MRRACIHGSGLSDGVGPDDGADRHAFGGPKDSSGGRSIPPGPGRDADRGWHARLHREDLGSLTVPTLVLVGRHDFICGMHWAEELHRVIPGSELLILENSGHFGHIEEPEAFSPAVTRFVATVNSPGI